MVWSANPLDWPLSRSYRNYGRASRLSKKFIADWDKVFWKGIRVVARFQQDCEEVAKGFQLILYL